MLGTTSSSPQKHVQRALYGCILKGWSYCLPMTLRLHHYNHIDRAARMEDYGHVPEHLLLGPSGAPEPRAIAVEIDDSGDQSEKM
jgi:hypothetical protein